MLAVKRADVSAVRERVLRSGGRGDGLQDRRFGRRAPRVAERADSRSDIWAMDRLQAAGLVKKGRRLGPHRARTPATGMMLHQDTSTHECVARELWDRAVKMDDATGEVYSGFFVKDDGTWSSFRGIHEYEDGGLAVFHGTLS